jgi:Tol biopolymer transport system component
MRRSLVVASVVVWVAGVVVSLAVAGGLGVGEGRSVGEIVFTRWAGDRYSSPSDLFVVALDGPRLRVLARDASAAAVSRDGRRIAFVRGDEIWVMRRDGSGQRQVTNPNKRPAKQGTVPPVSDSDPAWSPDGKTLYLSRFVWRTYEYSLFSVRSDGTGLRRFTKTCDTDPAPSPDGRVVAFVSSDRCERSLESTVIAVTAVGRPTRLPFVLPSSTWSMMFLLSPAWSPDGTTLAYEAYDGDPEGNRIGKSGLYISRSDGSPPLRLVRPTTGNAPVGNPSWSRDGTWITYDRSVGEQGPGDIWVIHPDGTASHRITSGKPNDTDPTWLGGTSAHSTTTS